MEAKHYSFQDFLKACDYDCVQILEQITCNLAGFRDEAIYEGRQVFFYKRAQILIADLIGAYKDFFEATGE